MVNLTRQYFTTSTTQQKQVHASNYPRGRKKSLVSTQRKYAGNQNGRAVIEDYAIGKHFLNVFVNDPILCGSSYMYETSGHDETIIPEARSKKFDELENISKDKSVATCQVEENHAASISETDKSCSDDEVSFKFDYFQNCQANILMEQLRTLLENFDLDLTEEDYNFMTNGIENEIILVAKLEMLIKHKKLEARTKYPERYLLIHCDHVTMPEANTEGNCIQDSNKLFDAPVETDDNWYRQYLARNESKTDLLKKRETYHMWWMRTKKDRDSHQKAWLKNNTQLAEGIQKTQNRKVKRHTMTNWKIIDNWDRIHKAVSKLRKKLDGQSTKPKRYIHRRTIGIQTECLCTHEPKETQQIRKFLYHMTESRKGEDSNNKIPATTDASQNTTSATSIGKDEEVLMTSESSMWLANKKGGFQNLHIDQSHSDSELSVEASEQEYVLNVEATSNEDLVDLSRLKLDQLLHFYTERAKTVAQELPVKQMVDHVHFTLSTALKLVHEFERNVTNVYTAVHEYLEFNLADVVNMHIWRKISQHESEYGYLDTFIEIYMNRVRKRLLSLKKIRNVFKCASEAREDLTLAVAEWTGVSNQFNPVEDSVEEEPKKSWTKNVKSFITKFSPVKNKEIKKSGQPVNVPDVISSKFEAKSCSDCVPIPAVTYVGSRKLPTLVRSE